MMQFMEKWQKRQNLKLTQWKMLFYNMKNNKLSMLQRVIHKCGRVLPIENFTERV